MGLVPTDPHVRFSAHLVHVASDGENKFFTYRLKAWWDDGDSPSDGHNGLLLFDFETVHVGLASHEELVEMVRWRVDRLREWQTLVDAASIEGVL